MTIFKPFIFICALSIALIGRAEAAYEKLQVRVTDTTRQQGEFFTITVANATGEPSLQFLDHPYRMFRLSDGSWRALVPVENLTLPGSYPLLVRSGESEEKIAVTIEPNNRAIQHITLDSSRAALKATELEKSRVKAALQTQSPEQLFSGKFLRPVDGPTSSLFGLKRSYNDGPVDSYHKGLDIDAPEGAAVKSSAKGRVILTGTVSEGFQVNGNTVIIDHGQALLSVYLHLSSIKAKEGEVIEAGEIIGAVGQTGISTAPHLHWGIYLYDTSVNPELFEGKSL